MHAMQTPRCISHTEVMLSQASQLPRKPAPTFVQRFFQRWVLSHEMASANPRQANPTR